MGGETQSCSEAGIGDQLLLQFSLQNLLQSLSSVPVTSAHCTVNEVLKEELKQRLKQKTVGWTDRVLLAPQTEVPLHFNDSKNFVGLIHLIRHIHFTQMTKKLMFSWY